MWRLTAARGPMPELEDAVFRLPLHGADEHHTSISLRSVINSVKTVGYRIGALAAISREVVPLVSGEQVLWNRFDRSISW